MRKVAIVSIVVPFGGLPFRILNIDLVKPKKGATMESIGGREERLGSAKRGREQRTEAVGLFGSCFG